ncbi:purine nucleosidase [Geomicrobium halophilum]|uniref:Purine nucleosidase n=1 Tax=Geomicrobium halophilum TaxID=549000 RepID=A0A841Q0X7_9BACL|nr:nucleoside hydrolase [Geomicrobium halophilum]MBB6451422.1 purine nucleosidase [Geomicrobium halophilum]
MSYVILDVDTGIDDALAIAYAAHSPEVNILGITTTFGNATVKETTRNTLQVLDLLEADNIPVMAGADKTFMGDEHREKSTWIHGENGIGDVWLPQPQRGASQMEAHEYIISKVREYPHQVTIVTVANQTNLAAAIQQDQELPKLVREVVVMGGAVTVPGNITPYAEANIYTDPEAANYVFQSGTPITLVGLDVTMKTLLKRNCLDDWRQTNTDLSLFLADMCDFYMEAYRGNQISSEGCALHDPLTVGVLIDPSFVQAVPMHVEVETTGENRGQTVGDKNQPPSNIKVCTDIESDRFVSHFLKRVVHTVTTI